MCYDKVIKVYDCFFSEHKKFLQLFVKKNTHATLKRGDERKRGCLFTCCLHTLIDRQNEAK